jgi:hypothetical protein
MSLIISTRRDIKAVFKHDPVGEKLEDLERRIVELEQSPTIVEGSK